MGPCKRIFSFGTNIHTHFHCGIDLDKHTRSDKGAGVPYVHTDTCIMSVHTYMLCETQIQHHTLKHTIPYEHFVPYLSISWLLIHSDCSAHRLLADSVPSAHCSSMTLHAEIWHVCNAFYLQSVQPSLNFKNNKLFCFRVGRDWLAALLQRNTGEQVWASQRNVTCQVCVGLGNVQ